jgi:Tol biopolymer transport system component
MSDAGRRTQLTSDEWRRIGVVLDRLCSAAPESREAVLLSACREQNLAISDVRPFVDAEQRSRSLPEQVPPELIAGALGDAVHGPQRFRLETGTRLGPYEIVASLGAGGMGEVYRAKDTRLGRTVAVKVLRPHLLGRADAHQRFDREARAISSLNHPHVCALHDVGHHDGVDFLVMEYVEGATLAQRLQRGAIPAAQAIRFASQIADALDRAHRLGIVHRDLKPANIMITRTGVKVLDFGLARLEPSGASETGVVAGTPAYMSPEQLRGAATDARSDIFACGAVFYEMVTGKRAFGGPSQAAVVAAILEHQPPPVEPAIPGVPAALDSAISRCLAKDPEERWQSAADLKHHLDWLASGIGTPRSAIWRDRSRIWIAAAIVAALALGAWAWRQRAVEPDPPAIAVFAIDPPPETTFELTQALSRDGRRVAFTAARADGTRELWIRALDSLAAQRITGSEGAAFPFWSPDGLFVGFFADRKLKKVALASSVVQVICDAGGGGGGTWNEDDVIVFAPESGITAGLRRVSASGGAAAPLTNPGEGLRLHAWPQFLPDGKRFIYMRAGENAPGIYVGRLDSKDTHTLVLPHVRTPPDLLQAVRPSDRSFGATKAIVAGDTIFFLDQTTLMAQRFDATRLDFAGEPVRVADNIDIGAPGRAAFDASAGVVTYRQAAPARPVQLTWVERSGKTVSPLGRPGPYVTASISHSGDFVLANWWDVRGRAQSGTVTRIDVATGAATPLFPNASGPVWSPDGSRVVFTQFGPGRGPTPTVAVLDGATPPRPLADFGAQAHATDWSRDGRYIVGSALNAATGADIWIADAEGREPFRYLVREPFHEREPRISPDGRWMAYAATDAQGGYHVYVRSFPGGGLVRRISIRGGRSPRWRRDGRELYYVEPGGRLMRVPLASGSELSTGAPQQMFQNAGLAGEPQAGFVGFAYDVAPDGTRFLMAIPSSDAAARAPTVVMLNWSFPGPR